MPKGHIPALDGLRGVAIILIMTYHFVDLFQIPRDGMDRVFFRVCGAGWIGVDLFFVLSGYLITSVLYESKGSAHYFRDFHIRRFLRILPLYYGILAVAFVLLPLVVSPLPRPIQALREQQWCLWLFLTNWVLAFQGGFGEMPAGYLWWLALDQQFCFVWPFFVFLLDRRRLVILSTSLFFASFLVRLVMLGLGAPTTSVYLITLTHMEGLAAGSLLAVSLDRHSEADRLLHALRCWALLAAAVLAAVFVWRGKFYFWDFPVALVASSLLPISFTYLVATARLARPGSLVDTLLSSPPLRSLGLHSYALYLLHRPLGKMVSLFLVDPLASPLFGSTIPAMVLFLTVATALSWLLSLLSWHLCEKHFLRLKESFRHPRQGRLAEMTG